MPIGASRLSFLAKAAEAAAVAQRTARTITAVNDAQIDTAQYKFGGSSYLGDGTSDYLTVDVADFGSTVGSSGDFTIECFARTSNTANKGIFHIHADPDYNASSGANSVAAAFYSNGSANWQVYFKGTSSQALGLTASANSTNTWYHVAVVRYSGTMYLYIDGVQQWSSTDTYDYSSARYLQFGAYYNSGYSLPGNIDEFRISKTARYTTGFTPTTTAFVNDSNTLLLIHADGTDGDTVFIDDNGDRGPVGLTAFGNAQIDTAQYKFGSSSLLLDGTGDFVPMHNLTALGTGDFTIECWARPATTPGTYDALFTWNHVYDWNEDPDGTIVPGLVLSLNALHYGVGSTTFTSGSSSGTWSHYAAVRNSGTLKVYVDGVEKASVTDTTDKQIGSIVPAIGIFDRYLHTGSPGGRFFFNGHIDEFRVSQTARYTSGFTPSTTAFENDANTLLLLHFEQQGANATEIFDDNGQTLSGYTPPPDYTVPTAAFTSDGNTEFLCSWDGTNGQTSATDESSNSHTITFSGASADLSTTQAKFGTASVDLNFSSTDSIYFGDGGTSAWYNQDTTIECWVYYDTLTGAQAGNGLPRVMGSFVTTGGGNYWSFGAKNDGSLQFFYYAGASYYVTSATGLINANQWHHIAMVYNHSTGAIRVLCDGFEVASGTKAAGSYSNHGYVRLGNYSGTPDAYVDEIRISHTQRY